MVTMPGEKVNITHMPCMLWRLPVSMAGKAVSGRPPRGHLLTLDNALCAATAKAEWLYGLQNGMLSNPVSLFVADRVSCPYCALSHAGQGAPKVHAGSQVL